MLREDIRKKQMTGDRKEEEGNNGKKYAQDNQRKGKNRGLRLVLSAIPKIRETERTH